MALERKPVEEVQKPGYPSTDEYVTGRRAFMGLLGLTALGVGGVYMLKRETAPTAGVPPTSSGGGSVPRGPVGGLVAQPQSIPGGEAAPLSDPTGARAPGPSLPQAVIRGDVGPVEPPVQPQAMIDGDVAAPKPPDAKPVAPPPGAPPRPAEPQAKLLGDVAPAKPTHPEAQIRGRIRTVQPFVQPAVEAGERPKSPAQPAAAELGVAARPRAN